MTNEKVYITIELEPNTDVWSLLDLPGRIVDITGAEHISGEKYSVPASEALSKPGEWVRHTGTECPVHPLDVVEVMLWGNHIHSHERPAYQWGWRARINTITHYRHVTDPDGIPYVYDDGSLPEWAEYVATDEDGEAWCYENQPESSANSPDRKNCWFSRKGAAHCLGSGSPYVNKGNALALVPFTESLRRIWREE